MGVKNIQDFPYFHLCGQTNRQTNKLNFGGVVKTSRSARQGRASRQIFEISLEKMLKILTIKTKYVEEEIFIDVEYVEKETENIMVIHSGAPVSLVSSV